MQRVVYPQAAKTNCFSVHRVANGWLVQMPQLYQMPEQENLYAGLVPALKEVMKYQNEDPLLSELRGEEEEEHSRVGRNKNAPLERSREEPGKNSLNGRRRESSGH